MKRVKLVLLNLFSVCVIIIGSAFLMQGQAHATATNSAVMLAQCPNGTCGQTCGTATVMGVEVCVCSGECPESDEPEQLQSH